MEKIRTLKQAVRVIKDREHEIEVLSSRVKEYVALAAVHMHHAKQIIEVQDAIRNLSHTSEETVAKLFVEILALRRENAEIVKHMHERSNGDDIAHNDIAKVLMEIGERLKLVKKSAKRKGK